MTLLWPHPSLEHNICQIRTLSTFLPSLLAGDCLTVEATWLFAVQVKTWVIGTVVPNFRKLLSHVHQSGLTGLELAKTLGSLLVSLCLSAPPLPVHRRWLPWWPLWLSGYGAAASVCSLCRWSRRLPVGVGSPGTRQSCSHRPQWQGHFLLSLSCGSVSACPQKWLGTLPLKQMTWVHWWGLLNPLPMRTWNPGQEQSELTSLALQMPSFPVTIFRTISSDRAQGARRPCLRGLPPFPSFFNCPIAHPLPSSLPI